MTFSAPVLSVNTISAMTVGVDVKILQLCSSPPMGSIADSISADVVPGAKLLPCTTYGPANPRILYPLPGARAVACAPAPFIMESDCTAANKRLSLVMRTLEFSRGRRETRDAWGLLTWCRSWPQVASMFALGLGVEDAERCDA